MTSKTTTPSRGEVYLGGTRFPIAEQRGRPGRVTSLDITQPPPRRVEGDITRESNPNLSTMSWSDFRGGIGLDIMEGFETNRCWETDCDIRFKRVITLGPLINQTSEPADKTVFAVLLGTFEDEVYVRHLDSGSSLNIFSYTNSNDTWSDTGDNIVSAGAVRTNIASFKIGAVDYLAQGQGNTGFAYTSNGTTWTEVTSVDAIYLVGWDNRLWGMDKQGALWYTFDFSNINTVAFLPIDAAPTTHGHVEGLFVGPDATGNSIIYALCNKGLFAFDAANERFIATAIQYVSTPERTTGGRVVRGNAGITWRNNIYVANDDTILEYSPVHGTLRNIGFTLDGGMPVGDRGYFVYLAASSNELFGIVDSDEATENDSILAWDTRGWRTLFRSSGNDKNLLDLHVTPAYGEYRLWWSQEDSLRYINLPRGLSSSIEASAGFTFAVASTLKTPWFHADQVDVDKLAVRLKVETSDTSTSGTVESVKIEYAVDYNEGSSDANYLTLANSTFTDGLIDTDTTGVTQTTFVFPLDTADITVAPVGKTFRAIRFKASLARGGTTTNSPKLISMTLEYRKKFERKEGFSFVLDFTGPYNGQSAAKRRTSLQALVESNTLSEFTFRNDSGGSRNYYVDVRIPGAEEDTGHLETGQTLVEVREL